ncbi:hypothetical protein [Filomicrobium sp.]|uniref:hypothetical protein n=1 Tax=Filomicrobium sp. TaxID=2024831 RepID=UPI0025858F1A|nr:hypothetical protein [Filomicrobium sp.]MCV0371745.1 hypothetical protein [Filomicrobium sp.]
MTAKGSDDNVPVFDMAAAKANFHPVIDNSRKGRKARHQAVSRAKDGRSLRATGRTEQFNFKSTPGLKKQAQAAAQKQGLTLAEWMENAVKAALGVDGGQT